jgi:hypothetical protein
MVTHVRGTDTMKMRHVIATALVVLLFAGTAAAQPSAPEILHRVLNANADTPDVKSAEVVFKLRVRKPQSEAPDCEFTGTMQMAGGRQSVKIDQSSAGLLCWAVNKYVLGQLFEASEPMEAFLGRFDFHILGEKLVERQHYYLVQGKARDTNNNPRSMIGWIDFERGLITDGTLEYNWGTIETEQRYTRQNGAWLLAHQLVRTSRFDATLEISYSNFLFVR